MKNSDVNVILVFKKILFRPWIVLEYPVVECLLSVGEALAISVN